MAFQIPKQVQQNPTDLIKRWRTIIDERIPVVEVFYAAFDDNAHFADNTRQPNYDLPPISIGGDTVLPLIANTNNQIYADTKSLLNRLVNGTATEQEQADVRGWKEFRAAIGVPGAKYVGDGFELPEVDEDGV